MSGHRGGRRSTSFNSETARAAAAKPRPRRVKFAELVADLPDDLTKGEFAEFCRRKLLEHRDVLDAAIASAGERMAALRFLAERGYGQATQTVEMSGPGGGPIATAAKIEDARDPLSSFLREWQLPAELPAPQSGDHTRGSGNGAKPVPLAEALDPEPPAGGAVH